MASAEKRTLSISAKLNDQLSRPLGTITAKFAAFGKSAALAAKSIFDRIFNLRGAVIGLAASFLSLSTVKAFGTQADELLKLARATGDSVENISELQAAFSLTVKDGENFDAVLRALLSAAREAQAGNLDLANAFAAIGISIEELRTLGPSQLFEQMAQGLESFGTAQEKAAALGKVLPRQFLALAPLIGEGLDKFQDAVKQAREAGATVFLDQARIADDLGTSLSKIQLAIGGVSRALIAEFGPAAIVLFERLSKSITENREGIVAIASAIGELLTGSVYAAVTAVIELIGVVEKLQGLLGKVGGLPGMFFASQGSIVEEGTAERLRNLRDQIQSEFSAAVQQVRDGGTASGFTSGAGFGGDVPAPAAPTPPSTSVFGPTAGPALFGRDDPEAGRSTDLALKNLKAQTDEMARLAGLAPGVNTLRDKLADLQRQAGVLELQDAKAKGLITLDDMNAAMAELEQKTARIKQQIGTGEFWGGFNQGAREAVSAFSDFSEIGREAAQSIVGEGLDGVSNALSDVITKTNETSQVWKNLARQLLGDLAKIIAKLITAAAISAIGLADGGVVQGQRLATGGVVQGNMGVPFQAFASGGIANGPTLALFGEGRNREAFVPLPDNRTIPVTLSGDRGGTSYTFNINAVDGADVRRMLVNERETIAAIWRNEATTRTSMRQIVQQTARR